MDKNKTQPADPNVIDLLWAKSKASKEVFDSLKVLVEAMKTLRQAVGKELTDEKGQITDFGNKIADFQNILQQIETQFNTDLTTTVQSAFEQKMKSFSDDLSAQFAELKASVPTKIPAPQITQITKEVESKLLPDDLRNKLETLDGDNRLDESAIKGLDEKFKELRKLINSRFMGRNVSPGARMVQVADLSSQCNGVTKTFTVPLHTFIISLQGTEFPQIYRPNVDFTTANTILTLGSGVSAPATGQTLVFLYVK